MLVVNLHSFFEDLQENQEEMALQVKQAKMAQRELQEEMAETEGMVRREYEVYCLINICSARLFLCLCIIYRSLY
jgi:hypothetical protein